MPFDFLLDELPASVKIAPAIGMYYIYCDGKNVLIFRKTGKSPQHNGIWISTKREHHASLKADIPAITDFTFDHATETDWLLLSDAHEDFEFAAIQLCELVAGKDQESEKSHQRAWLYFSVRVLLSVTMISCSIAAWFEMFIFYVATSFAAGSSCRTTLNSWMRSKGLYK